MFSSLDFLKSFFFLFLLTKYTSCRTKIFSLFAETKRKAMKGLTAKEEEMMGFFWEKGPLYVKEIIEFYDEPRPHFNTISTYVRSLEEKGYVGHKGFGRTYQYYALVSREDFQKRTLRGVISKYFNNSYLGVVSSLVREEEISLDELKELIREVEKGSQQ